MASDNYLVFERFKWSGSGTLLESALLLYDRNSGAMTTLEDGMSNYYRPTFAGTTYVAWTVCGSVGCAIHYWSAAGGEQIQPSVPGRDQYSAWIDEATGQVYLRPGEAAHLRQAGDDPAVDARLEYFDRPGVAPARYRYGREPMSLATDVATSSQDLYFERWSCRQKTGDIYALEGVDTV